MFLGILFLGFIGVVCVVYINGEYIFNFVMESLEDFDLDFVVVGIFDVVLMVEL